MSQIVNLLHLKPGDKIRLTTGNTAEVISNPMDGFWVTCRHLSSATDPDLEGTEELIYAEEISEVIEPIQ